MIENLIIYPKIALVYFQYQHKPLFLFWRELFSLNNLNINSAQKNIWVVQILNMMILDKYEFKTSNGKKYIVSICFIIQNVNIILTNKIHLISFQKDVIK